MSSNDLFLCEVSLILVVDSKFSEGVELGLLDSLHLLTVLLQLLADLATLFQVVQPILLLHLRVLPDLVPIISKFRRLQI